MGIIRFLRQMVTIAMGCFLALLGLWGVVVYLFLGQVAKRKTALVGESSILTLHITGRIVEAGQGEMELPLIDVKERDACLNLKKIKSAIRSATKDDRIRAIFLKLSYFQAGWAVLEEIRTDLLAFQKAGKSIVAYGNAYDTNKAYYLASLANEIVIHPSGFCNFNGLSATIYFYTKFLDKLFIKPYIFRVGKCKDAVEPFYLHKMSQESRGYTEDYLRDVYGHFLTHIGLSRNIAVADLDALACNLSAVLPHDALKAKLVTKIDHEAGVKQWIEEQYGKTMNKKEVPFIDCNDYLLDKSVMANHKGNGKAQVAVISAEGMIVEGHSSSPDYLGADSFVKDLKAVQKDDAVKAVVLRINSPGGLASASETMWRAIEELKQSKPVVASLSNLAASGGYYIAAPCHYVVAQPTTLTGCIGIFSVIFDFDSFLINHIGIEHDVVKTTPSADFLNPRVAYSDVEYKLMHRYIEHGYHDFVGKVCKGRRMDIIQAKALSDGRLYTGNMGLKNGLVDALGGLETAVEKAVALANLKEGWEVIYLPHLRSKWERLLHRVLNYMMGNRDIQKEVADALLKDYPLLHHLHGMRTQKGMQAMLPYAIDIV